MSHFGWGDLNLHRTTAKWTVGRPMHNQKFSLKSSTGLCTWSLIGCLLYLPMYNVHFFLTIFASNIEMRIIHITFCFHELICITKNTKLNNSQFYETRRNKSRQKVCLALYITSVHVRQSCNSSLTFYDHDWKSVAFSLVFRWQSKFHEEFAFGLCKNSVNSLIFWFFEQMWKDLKEKRLCKYSPLHHL